MQRLQVVHKGGFLRSFSFCLAAMAASPFPAWAERLAVKTYTMADGLPRNSVNCIRRDSHGFLWFCTDEGISRFDGYTFTNYGVEQGLPDGHVADFLESRSGEYWVATADGLCRFNPRPSQASGREPSPGSEPSRRPMFEVFRPGPRDFERRISAIVEDHDGALWCGTIGGGLYRFNPRNGRFDFVALDKAQVDDLLLDHEGALWIGLEGGLLRRWPDGRIERYAQREGLPGGETHALRVTDLLEDAKGRLWAGTLWGLCRLVADPKPGRPIVERVYTTRDGLPSDHIDSLFQSAEGVLWVSAQGSLAEFVPEGERWPRAFRSYFSGGEVVGEDTAGNLWVGTSRWARDGFTSYTAEDGLASHAISSIFEDQQGRLCVVTEDKWGRGRFINRLEGQHFVPIKPKVPASGLLFTWGWGRIHFQDHNGAWWIATGNGLCRYPKLRRMEDLAYTVPDAIYTTRDGLASYDIYQLFGDSRGDVWVSVIGPDVVTVWSRADEKFHNYARDAGGKALGTPLCFAEDRTGNVWMGFFWHNLARYRNGRFEVYTTANGLPPGVIRSIYTDHAGRLWLATSRGGLLRVDNPDADRPSFVPYTTAQGLSSNETGCITEDAWGRVYVATGRGVDRLDPQTRHIQHYSADEGLGPAIRTAFRDRRGALWFGGSGGVSRLIPREDPHASPPPIRITSVRLRGTPYSVSELGETNLTVPALRPSDNQLELSYASLNFAAGEVIRYQYKLEGSDRDWGPPTDLRTVNYASLSPGSYHFLVRAVNSESVLSARPAEVTFTILPPVWRRWWFLTLATLLVAAAASVAYRFRVDRLLELERVRTRIATDLHDDIGSSLSQIAILSEVAGRRIRNEAQEVMEPLGEIAGTARELVDSMSDIVWAIDPQHDRLADLAGRMRHFAGHILTPRNINFRFCAPAEDRDFQVPADLRRQIYLIFKESLNNIARHSGCSEADIELRMEKDWLVLRIHDNGQGFDPGTASKGHGLASMRERARKMGGEIEIMSREGQATDKIFRVPTRRLAASHWRRLLHKYAGTHGPGRA